MTTLTRSTVSDFENQHRADHECEHGMLLDAQGRVLVVRQGGYDEVSFTPQELQQGVGGLLTHSHPRCLAPSGQDLAIAAEYGLTLRAVGLASDTHQSFDHTVSFATPDPELARILPSLFDDEVEQAEKELAAQPYADLQWQREARHRAVQRLAKRYQFRYRRVERNKILSETSRREQQRIDIQLSVSPTLQTQIFTPLVNNLVSHLTREAGTGGQINPIRLSHLRQTMHSQVQRVFLGTPLRDGTLEPYTVERGEVIPRSPYFKCLWGLMHRGAQAAIDVQADLMRKHLPEDLVRQFEMATLDPFDEPLVETEQEPPDPLHLWVGPDGKRLSDRIWNLTGDMIRKLDEYLTIAIAQHRPVQQMAVDLEAYLQPGVGGWAALRLARTETSAAYHRAGWIAAMNNPLVERYQPVLSPTHKELDHCDDEAAKSYAKDDPSHLPPFHANCQCSVIWLLVEKVGSVIKTIRDQIAAALAKATRSIVDYITPLSKRFIQLLFRGR